MQDRPRQFTLTFLFVTTLLALGFLIGQAFGDANDKAVAEPAPPTDPEALRVVTFWIEAGPALWFAKDPEFDARFRERFLREHERAARGELQQWLSTADGALALPIRRG